MRIGTNNKSSQASFLRSLLQSREFTMNFNPAGGRIGCFRRRSAVVVDDRRGFPRSLVFVPPEQDAFKLIARIHCSTAHRNVTAWLGRRRSLVNVTMTWLSS